MSNRQRSLRETAVSIEQVVAVLYKVISGPADLERDWDGFRALFWPGTRLRLTRWTTPEGEEREDIRDYDVESFIETATPIFRESGFWEHEIWSRMERFGNIAHVLSTYESRLGSPQAKAAGRGINSIQLLFHEGRWWIASIAWDVERANNPIPAEYLPKP